MSDPLPPRQTADPLLAYILLFFFSVTIADPRTDSSDWLKMNVGQFGYFRVNYEVEMWNALANQLIEEHTV